MRHASSIVIVLKLKDDPTFEVSGLDLLVPITISLQESLFGFNRVILTHLDGRQIKVDRTKTPGKKTKVTKGGSVERIKGEGMPGKTGERGDLYIRWEVDWPEDGWADGEKAEELKKVSDSFKWGLESQDDILLHRVPFRSGVDFDLFEFSPLSHSLPFSLLAAFERSATAFQASDTRRLVKSSDGFSGEIGYLKRESISSTRLGVSLLEPENPLI